MKIIKGQDTNVITETKARTEVERAINNKTEDSLYVVKYNDELISISGEYYKFAWKNIDNLRSALSMKFGKDLAEALVESGILEVVKVYI